MTTHIIASAELGNQIEAIVTQVCMETGEPYMSERPLSNEQYNKYICGLHFPTCSLRNQYNDGPTNDMNSKMYTQNPFKDWAYRLKINEMSDSR